MIRSILSALEASGERKEIKASGNSDVGDPSVVRKMTPLRLSRKDLLDEKKQTSS
jgi:hypothetical protein